MFIYQIIMITSLLTTYGVLIFLFCRIFTKKLNLPFMLVIPIIIFSLGFILRLSEQKSLIDVGYFLTDSSSIFLYALFTGALILGQIKFWKK
jgi:hypothetical protein